MCETIHAMAIAGWHQAHTHGERAYFFQDDYQFFFQKDLIFEKQNTLH